MQNQKINVDDFINEITKQTGVHIDKRDPIIVLLAVNKILLQESQEIHQKILNGYRDDMMQLSLKTLNETKENSTKLINAAVQATKNSFNNAIEESSNDFVNALVSQNIKARENDLKDLNLGINKLKKLITLLAGISIINILTTIIFIAF